MVILGRVIFTFRRRVDVSARSFSECADFFGLFSLGQTEAALAFGPNWSKPAHFWLEVLLRLLLPLFLLIAATILRRGAQ